MNEDEKTSDPDSGRHLQLVARLIEAADLLRAAGDLHWSKWLEESRHGIERHDLSAYQHLLSAYGGMGSFNDIVLTSENGHRVTKVDSSVINDQLDSLRDEIYHLARAARPSST